MAQPGWYPNPDGTPQTMRYWDGTSWSSQVVSVSQAPLNQPAAPPSTPVAAKGAPVGLIVAIITGVVALALVALFVVFNPFRAVVPEPGPTPIRNATTAPTASAAVGGCPTTMPAGQLTDGRLTVAVPNSFTIQKSVPSWATCGGQATKKIANGWYSVMMVGAVDTSQSPEQVANAIWKWNLSNNYTNFTAPKPTIAASSPKTFGSQAGWVIHGTIEIPDPALKGDDVTIYVVSGPSNTVSTVLAVSTLALPDNKAEVDAALATIKVR